MVRLHHQLNGYKFEQILGDSEGQGSLACCSPRGHKESDTTQQLNNIISHPLLPTQGFYSSDSLFCLLHQFPTSSLCFLLALRPAPPSPKQPLSISLLPVAIIPFTLSSQQKIMYQQYLQFPPLITRTHWNQPLTLITSPKVTHDPKFTKSNGQFPVILLKISASSDTVKHLTLSSFSFFFWFSSWL